MTLEKRLTELEATVRGKTTEPAPDIPSLDDIIQKLGFDPVAVRATAAENGQSIVEAIAGEMGISSQDLNADLKKRIRGA